MRGPARLRRWALSAILPLLVFSWAEPSARADDDEGAEAWKHRGDEAMDAGRPAEALTAYRRAASLEPSPALDYNVGRALLAVGDFAGALSMFERYEASAPEELKRKTHRLIDVMIELRSKVATLTVTCDAPSCAAARATVRGVEAGPLPSTLRLNPGRAEVRVERPGFLSFAETVDLWPGKTTDVVVDLRPVPVFGRLTIVANPRGAGVVVDGERRGLAPIDLELAPGTHDVVLSAPRHADRRLTVSLSGNDARRLDVTLAPSEPENVPITSRWWFWTGAGVLVAGAALAVVAVSVERAPSEGSLGTFQAPLTKR